MWKRLWIALILVMMCVLPVFAEEPPDALMRHVAQQRMVHDSVCTITPMHIKDVECLVFADDEARMLWVVLFDERLRTSHVLSVKDKKIVIVWVRNDLTT